MASGDVVIIGGGVMGLFTAIHLRELGAPSVTLLEKRFCGAGSSGKSGAILRQHYSNQTTAALARDSLGVFASFTQRFGSDAGFRRTGCLFFAPPEMREAMRNNVALLRGLAIDTEMIEPDRARAIEPRFDLGDEPAACIEWDAGYVDPMLVLAALEAAASRMGVEIRTGERAEAILVRTGAVAGVELSGGEILGAERVVLAAGAWSTALGRTVGLELPIRATRPQIAFTRRPYDAGFDRDHPIVCDLVNAYYCRPDLPSLTLVGGLDMEADPPIDDPDDEPEGIDDAIVAELNRRLTRRFPAMARGRSRGGMSALYACTPDYHPLVGPVAGIEGLHLCAGFSGHGFKLSPEIGRELAHHIVHGHWETHDLSLFRPERFEQNDPVRGRYEYSILG